MKKTEKTDLEIITAWCKEKGISYGHFQVMETLGYLRMWGRRVVVSNKYEYGRFVDELAR